MQELFAEIQQQIKVHGFKKASTALQSDVLSVPQKKKALFLVQCDEALHIKLCCTQPQY